MGEQAPSSGGPAGSGELELVGQWRARLDFQDGDFAAVDDLEFMYSFNAGGTLTESSNYDAAPPVPPAYGIWRRTGPDRFEAKYEFYPTSAPCWPRRDHLGWRLAVSRVAACSPRPSPSPPAEDAFTSTMLYEAFDAAGSPVEGGGTASGRGVRLRF